MKNILLPKLFQPFLCEDLVRLGKSNDGGYLINRVDVLKSDELISFGIGSDISFEEDFISLNPVNVKTYDSTVDSSSFKHFKENITFKNIKGILEEARTNFFLKCDIDGGEYEIFGDLINYSRKMSGLAIELHSIANRDNFNEIMNFVSKIDLKLVHAHLNNYSYYIMDDQMYVPDVIELSFTSSINITYDDRIVLPHSLDMPNNPDDHEFKIFF